MQLITYTQPEMRPICIYEHDAVSHSWTVLMMLEKIEAFLKDDKRKSLLNNKQFFLFIKNL